MLSSSPLNLRIIDDIGSLSERSTTFLLMSKNKTVLGLTLGDSEPEPSMAKRPTMQTKPRM